MQSTSTSTALMGPWHRCYAAFRYRHRAARANCQRTVAGIHYRGFSEAGVDLGRKVAHYDLNHAFGPTR